MDDFPIYSADARLAKDLFLCDYAGIIFYCEDSNHESVYERLIGRLIPNIKDFVVVCVGGKTELKKKFKEPSVGDVIRIFIADKDYDDLLGLMFSGDGFYYLDKSCLESYLIDINLFRAICVEEGVPRVTFKACTHKIEDWDRYFTSLKDAYNSVTRMFIVVRKFDIKNLKTTKMSLDELLLGANENFPVPTLAWCDGYRDKIKKNCLLDPKTSWLECDQALDIEISNAFCAFGKNSETKSADDHLNGKHILRCVLRYIKNRVGVDLEQMGCQKLYLRILDGIDLSPLFPLRDRVLSDFPELVRI